MFVVVMDQFVVRVICVVLSLIDPLSLSINGLTWRVIYISLVQDSYMRVVGEECC